MNRCDDPARFVLGALLLIAGVGPARGQGVLVWSDEFDGSVLDSGNWEPQIGNGHAYGIPGWGNNELEYYTDRPENLFVSGGNLHIVAREESYAGYNYTSARIRSLNKREFLYGRIEARIRLPQGEGMWPAFWMLPTNSPYGGWASSGEIDIMEAVDVPWTVHGTIHFGGGYPNNASSGGSYSNGSNFADGFHVYAIEWEEDAIRWYVDGVWYFSRSSANWWSEAAPGNPRAPFDVPFHLLLNVAVGGNWPGPPDATTTFPQEMLVDWVRVYDLGNVAPTVAIDAPADGAVLPVGDVTIEATAADDDGSVDRVEFYVDGALIGQDSTSPFSVVWSASQGCRRIKAVAIDNLGGMGAHEITVKIGAGCAGEPYLGAAAAIPGTVQLENFDEGGEGAAYHDCDSANNGGAYRPTEGVDIEPTSGGGFNLGWMCAGEWLDYAVQIAQGGRYLIEARVASLATGGAFALEFDGASVGAVLAVPVTGGWQTWTTASVTVTLQAGLQEMRLVNLGAAGVEYNLDWLRFTRFDDLDFDLDGDVDLTDWVWFLRCFSGTGASVPQGTCSAEFFSQSDVDGDGDVDLIDYAAFQRARTAP